MVGTVTGIRPMPGTRPRTGLPLAKPYVYRGTGSEMTPAEIVAHLRTQIVEQQYAGVLAIQDAQQLTRSEARIAMCPPCLDYDGCHDCHGVPCKCACQDES